MNEPVSKLKELRSSFPGASPAAAAGLVHFINEVN
jgi:hypothetical protein